MSWRTIVTSTWGFTTPTPWNCLSDISTINEKVPSAGVCNQFKIILRVNWSTIKWHTLLLLLYSCEQRTSLSNRSWKYNTPVVALMSKRLEFTVFWGIRYSIGSLSGSVAKIRLKGIPLVSSVPVEQLEQDYINFHMTHLIVALLPAGSSSFGVKK